MAVVIMPQFYILIVKTKGDIMGALPKRRISNRRRKNRRSHDSLKVSQLVPCVSCGEMKPPHIMCSSCRTYRGRQIFEPFQEEE